MYTLYPPEPCAVLKLLIYFCGILHTISNKVKNLILTVGTHSSTSRGRVVPGHAAHNYCQLRQLTAPPPFRFRLNPMSSSSPQTSATCLLVTHKLSM